ncbi:hypothetical protein ACF0H5_018447 [Mactra antiquata]
MAMPETIPQSIESDKDVSITSSPLMCGVCEEKFVKLDVFLLHVASHNTLYNKYLHVCESNTETFHSISDRSVYKCRTCCEQFSSICLLHNHIVHNSDIGSYIFDHTKNTAYPLSMKCSGDTIQGLCEENTSMRADSDGDDELDKLIRKIEEFLQVFALKFNFEQYNAYMNHSTVTIDFNQAANNKSDGTKLKERNNSEEVASKKANDVDDISDGLIENDADKGIKKVDELLGDFSQKSNVKSEKIDSNMEQSTNDCRQVETDKNEESSQAQKFKISNLTQPELNKLIAKGNVIFVRKKVSVINTNVGRRKGVASNSKRQTISVGRKQPNVQNDRDKGNHRKSFAHLDELSESSEPFVNLVDPKFKSIGTMSNKFSDINNEITSIESETNKPNKIQGNVFDNGLKVKPQKRKSEKLGPNAIPTRIKPLDPYPLPSDESECPHCCKRFVPCKMKIHLMSHTDERPFKCDKCPKSYKYRHNFLEHRASHEEVKPFYCEICGQGMTTGYALKNHKLVHHSTSKPFICEECGAAFKLKSRLTRHESTHTGIKSQQCELCGMKFARRYNLTIHVRSVHNKDKRFTCNKCDKNFLTNYQLKVHLMKHSGERPYKCSVCTTGYIEKKELKKHLKKQHNLSMEEANYTIENLPTVTTEDMYIPASDHTDSVQTTNIDHLSYTTCGLDMIG